MSIGKQIRRAGAAAVFIAVFTAGVRAQTLVNEALSSFPGDTLRIEYSHPEVLRSLPDYSEMRQRYEGPRLQQLEQSLSQLGIQEADVDELVLGWQAAGRSWNFFGLTAGRFDLKALASRATAQGVAPVPIGGHKAYCVGSGAGADCVVLLGDSLGAFGQLASLKTILAVRAGSASSLESSNTFAKLVGEADTKDPIWGVAVGAAVPDWYRGWMPNQNDLKLDWSQAFKSVQALIYGVDPGTTVRLNVRMDCTSSEDAASLRQVFDGLRLYQQISWQNQNPGKENPFKNLQIQAEDNRVLLQLDSSYADVMSVGGI